MRAHHHRRPGLFFQKRRRLSPLVPTAIGRVLVRVRVHLLIILHVLGAFLFIAVIALHHTAHARALVFGERRRLSPLVSTAIGRVLARVRPVALLRGDGRGDAGPVGAPPGPRTGGVLALLWSDGREGVRPGGSLPGPPVVVRTHNVSVH